MRLFVVSQHLKMVDLIKLVTYSKRYDENSVRLSFVLVIAIEHIESINWKKKNKAKSLINDSSKSTLCKQQDLVKLMTHFDGTCNIGAYLAWKIGTNDKLRDKLVESTS